VPYDERQHIPEDFRNNHSPSGLGLLYHPLDPEKHAYHRPPTPDTIPETITYEPTPTDDSLARSPHAVMSKDLKIEQESSDDFCESKCDQDLATFVFDVILRFSCGRLSASGTTRPFEARFQHEFYLCCHIYSKGSLISFPSFVNRKGRTDLYIPFKKWGVEVRYEGDGLENYSTRFAGQGTYAGMNFKDYIILDFRQTVPETQHPGQ
jgi:hypothetical protein